MGPQRWRLKKIIWEKTKLWRNTRLGTVSFYKSREKIEKSDLESEYGVQNCMLQHYTNILFIKCAQFKHGLDNF